MYVYMVDCALKFLRDLAVHRRRRRRAMFGLAALALCVRAPLCALAYGAISPESICQAASRAGYLCASLASCFFALCGHFYFYFYFYRVIYFYFILPSTAGAFVHRCRRPPPPPPPPPCNVRFRFSRIVEYGRRYVPVRAVRLHGIHMLCGVAGGVPMRFRVSVVLFALCDPFCFFPPLSRSLLSLPLFFTLALTQTQTHARRAFVVESRRGGSESARQCLLARSRMPRRSAIHLNKPACVCD